MNLKKMKNNLGYVVAVLSITGLAVGVAWADSQMVPFVPKSTTAAGCPGSNSGFAKMTNSVGGLWITPPTNAITGTFNNLSPFTCATCVTRKSDSMTWCDTNAITFPATNSSYQMMIYVKSDPAPTNGQPIAMGVTWNTN